MYSPMETGAGTKSHDYEWECPAWPVNPWGLCALKRSGNMAFFSYPQQARRNGL